jgi:hypothetical protein
VLVIGACNAQQPASLRAKAPELEGISDWVNTKPVGCYSADNSATSSTAGT